jgi:DNA-binding response OmpR family regulator
MEFAMPAQSPTLFARIIAIDSDVLPEELVLDGDICTIGRAPSCQITVPRNTVSRIHARIERDGLRYLLHDAGSANGTFVNSLRINGPRLLKDRDNIGLGAAAATLRFADPDPTFVPAGRLRYDEPSMRFFLDQRPIELTAAQFRLLSHLYQNAGNLCTRESCALAIWGRDYDPGLDSAALDRAIANLRGIFRQIDPASDPIQTRRKQGYLLEL